ncbi:23964_t:CDS:1, partial [Gigaspora margarita]
KNPLFLPVEEFDQPSNLTHSKKCRIEDSTLLELLEEERVLDEFREISKQVETEVKSQKNLNSTSTQKNLK